jgi:putative transposase
MVFVCRTFGQGLVELVPPKKGRVIFGCTAALWPCRISEMESRPNLEPGRGRLPHLASICAPNLSIIQFVTVNVKARRPLLAKADIRDLLLECWKKADLWVVGRFVLMPDHIHLFCAPKQLTPTALKAWVYFWRAEATRHWPREDEKPIWQKDFHDRQLRSAESYQQKWAYVPENPLRAGLVRKIEDWPWQGELNQLLWHEAA